MVYIIPAVKMQEDHKFEAKLVYVVRPSQEKGGKVGQVDASSKVILSQKEEKKE